MVEAGATAATDVTGFGLIGHGSEMADAGGVTLEINVGDVPIIEGALSVIERGLAPGGLFSNQHYYSRRVEKRTEADRTLVELMYDPQTSGGLLIALPPDALSIFETALGARCEQSWVIGRVIERHDRSVVLV
jgi:selenide,water dikinase